ncbi:hypothetical protein R1sor_013772 [Riccia sorocarpa]|uniref:Reverse transcriptase domain-containing protein n=1 Tax=Riccia sorocarpa TaxID=122646 RepID=A0ABD3H7N7_9MARC
MPTSTFAFRNDITTTNADAAGRESRGGIQGLNIGGGRRLLHQLFVDETGICITAEERQFNRLKEVIREFEVASGASLNLQKSIVMQVRPGNTPSWMHGGHVLAATPLYRLLSIGLCKDGLEDLWGWNEEGNPKLALIAWDRIALAKEEGGLGWTRFKVMADALNVRQVSRILEGGSAEWIQLAKSFVLRTLRGGAYQRECSQWTIEEGLLLLPLTKVEGSATLTRMLGSWYKARKKLHWKEDIGELNGSLSIMQVKAVQQIARKVGVSNLQVGREIGLLRKAGIHNFGDALRVGLRGVGGATCTEKESF